MIDELGWNIASFGSMTFKRRKLKRGLEPDECYWIQSEPLFHGRENIDLRRDPPPDLVLEIDVTHSALDRPAIYGEGYTSVGVLALPQEFITDTLRALPASERPWGRTAALIRTPLVNDMIFANGGTAFILGGPVTVAELDRMAEALVEQGIQ